MKEIYVPIAYINLIDAALKYAREHGLYKEAIDHDYIMGCLDDIDENFIQPLQKLDKDGVIIIYD